MRRSLFAFARASYFLMGVGVGALVALRLAPPVWAGLLVGLLGVGATMLFSGAWGKEVSA